MLTRNREAHERASPDTILSPLPRCFVRAVFLLLPVDTRLRCSEVSRAWRALLADASFFTTLNASRFSGVARFSVPLLRAAAVKAGGQLRVLDLSGQSLAKFLPEIFGVQLLLQLLLEVAVANAATLTNVRLDVSDWFPHRAVTRRLCT